MKVSGRFDFVIGKADGQRCILIADPDEVQLEHDVHAIPGFLRNAISAWLVGTNARKR